MAKQWQIRRGTEAENDTFTGALAEVTMDTTNNTVRIHDGVTPGGVELAKKEDIYHPTLFMHEWSDHILDSISWLRADTFSWHSGELYVAAYQHLEDEYDPDELPTITVNDKVYVRSAEDDDLNAIHPYCWRNDELSVNVTIFTTNEEPVVGDFTFGTSTAVIEDSPITAVGTVSVLSTETIDDITITYYRAEDGHKICLPDQEINISNLYDTTGIAWYYILDPDNERFKLPRTKWGFVGLRGEVGNYIAPGLPNIEGDVTFYGIEAWNGGGTGAFNINVSSDTAMGHHGGELEKIPSLNFNASRSNAVYGASSTVQPAATEMYLYFYVGTFDSITHDNPQDLVHKSGDETINGTKTFGDNIHVKKSSPFYFVYNNGVDLSENIPEGSHYSGIGMFDKNGYELSYTRTSNYFSNNKNVSQLDLYAIDPDLTHTNELGNRIHSAIYLKTDGETRSATLNFNPSHSDNSTQLITSKWYNDQRTNCITEIPQDIKIEIDSNNLPVVKANTVIYIPNGFEQDGTTPKFDKYIIPSDITGGGIENGSECLLYITAKNTIYIKPTSSFYSGTTEPDVPINRVWYDTTNNVIKWKNDQGEWVIDNRCLPICLCTVTNQMITSINQIFNGFGYIGSTVFALPGVKVLLPNGRNSDRTLKNQIGVVQSVQTVTQSGTYKRNVFVTTSGTLLITVNSYVYDVENNYNIVNSSVIGAAHIGVADMISDEIKTLSVKQPFRVVDYGDTEFIAYQSMPSGKYIDLPGSDSTTNSLPANGSEYYAPANGFFYLKINNTQSGTATSVGMDSYSLCAIGKSTNNPSGNEICACWLPVYKGEKIIISNNTTDATRIYFKFIYANGAK